MHNPLSRSQPVAPATEVIQVYRVTQAFYAEVRYRDELDRYCQWYEETAQRNRQELEQMRGDINPSRWFR